MNDIEAKAFKIGLMWNDECSKNLPDEQHDKFKIGKDPRKTSLFRYCYKVAKETAGLIPDSEMQLYVRAQIQILKSIREGKVHALITPHCLVGERAWKRWKVWKRIYDSSLSKNPTSEEIGVKIKESMIRGELVRTLSFIESKGLLDKDKYKSCKQDLARWAVTGEMSPFYFVLSPRIKSIFDEGDIPLDSALYRPFITPALEAMFKEKFSYEFGA
jgi:hypothetical protein